MDADLETAAELTSLFAAWFDVGTGVRDDSELDRDIRSLEGEKSSAVAAIWV